MKPKKELGQHFLTSPSIARIAIIACDVGPQDTVVEIGPGKGMLTRHLLTLAKKVVAIEKDREMVEILKDQFEKEIKDNKLEIMEGDARSYSPKKIFSYKLIGNIPYYITGELFEKFLSEKNQPKTLVFMVQREVAERIVAKDKKESVLSISIKAYGKPEIVRRVARGSFHPPPKVESALIKIGSISKNFFDTVSEEDFFLVLKKGFAHKRKFLIRNLSFFGGKSELLSIFHHLGLSPLIRPENLTVSGWKKIAEEIFPIHKKQKRVKK